MNKIQDSDISKGGIGIRLVKGEDSVIVDPGTPAESAFREQGYTEEGIPSVEDKKVKRQPDEIEKLTRVELNVLAGELGIQMINAFADDALVMAIKAELAERAGK